MMRSRMAVAALVAATAAVAGCGGGSSSDGRDERPAPVPEPRSSSGADVAFAGGSLPGTIYVNAGQDEMNGDLYRVDGSFSDATRITRDGRVSIFTGSRDGRLAVANARGAGTDRLEYAALDERDALPGELIDSAGQAPSFSPGGKLLYSKPRYRADGSALGIRYYVVSSRGGRPRAVFSSSDPDVLVDWGPGGQIAAVHDGKPPIVLDPGGERERRIDVPLESITTMLVNRDGVIAARDEAGRIAVVPPRGESRVFETEVVPLAWSPDGRSLLVSADGTRLALLDPADGSLRRVALVHNGEVYGAAWVPDGGE